jgi:hypothetical protein
MRNKNAFITINLLAGMLSISCRKTKNESQTKVVYGEKLEGIMEDFRNEGDCAALQFIRDKKINPNQIKQYASSASSRIQGGSALLENIKQERIRRGTDYILNDLQTKGYLHPVLLANIKSDIPFTGSNGMEVMQSLQTKTKEKATELSQKIRYGKYQNTLSIREALELALNTNQSDPYQSIGYLGALTIWDRFNSQRSASQYDASRDNFSMLPFLMSTLGPGDKTGQVYHFWGFVSLLGSEGVAKGLLLGQITTLGYEGFFNTLKTGSVDHEDMQIDNSAMAFGYGFFKTLLEQPTSDLANRYYKEKLCDSKIAQTTEKLDDGKRNDRSCKIWLAERKDYQDAKFREQEAKVGKYATYINTTDIGNCILTAKKAAKPGKTPSGELANTAYMEYGNIKGKPMIGIYSSKYFADGIIFATQPGPTEDCIAVNKSGGTCAELRQLESTWFCDKPAEYKDCVSKKSDIIEHIIAKNQWCINASDKNCAKIPASAGKESRPCQAANHSGGKCSDLKLYCAEDARCKPSSAEFSTCMRSNKMLVDTCLAENQHCLSADLDNCIPFDDLQKFSFSTIW